MKTRWPSAVLMNCLLVSSVWSAQPSASSAPPASVRAGAPLDLTGYWVAQVVEDWRWRMITPPKGDREGAPLTPAGLAVANQWDLEADNARGDQCKAFGAGSIMRQPTRLRISWQDDNTLKIETDAGQQTRLFRFSEDPVARSEARSWQGYSAAEWIQPPQEPVFGLSAASMAQAVGLVNTAPPPAATGVDIGVHDPEMFAPSGPDPGGLKVVTNNLRQAYLRKNGIPYSENTIVTEYYDRFSMFGSDYLLVVTIVEDPIYLRKAYVVSSQFKHEADGSKWNPQPCFTDPPTIDKPVELIN